MLTESDKENRVDWNVPSRTRNVLRLGKDYEGVSPPREVELGLKMKKLIPRVKINFHCDNLRPAELLEN